MENEIRQPKPEIETLNTPPPSLKPKRSKKKVILISLVAVLILAAFGGLYYWQNSKNQQLQKELDAVKAQLNTAPAVVEDTPATTKVPVEPNYTGWTKVTNEELQPNQTALYKSGTATLAVYSKNPILNYSSNAPAYCELEGDTWMHKGMAGDCSSVTKTTVGGNTAYTEYGGALGRIKYLVAAERNGQWFVFSDYKDHDPDSFSEADAKQHKDQLAITVDQLVSKTLPQN